MADGGTPCQAEAAVSGEQGLSGDLGAHAAIAQDKVRQDGAHRLARGALDAPDGEAIQANPGIMGVTGQTATTRTGRLVGKLEADREDEGQDKLDKRFASVDQLEVGRWLLEIDGEGSVLACRFGGLRHVSSPRWRWWVWMRHGGGNVLKCQAYCEYLRAPPLNSVECGCCEPSRITRPSCSSAMWINCPRLAQGRCWRTSLRQSAFLRYGSLKFSRFPRI